MSVLTVWRGGSAEGKASGQETGYGLGWDLETVTLAGIAQAFAEQARRPARN